jgi:hypothetical protein
MPHRPEKLLSDILAAAIGQSLQGRTREVAHRFIGYAGQQVSLIVDEVRRPMPPGASP